MGNTNVSLVSKIFCLGIFLSELKWEFFSLLCSRYLMLSRLLEWQVSWQRTCSTNFFDLIGDAGSARVSWSGLVQTRAHNAMLPDWSIPRLGRARSPGLSKSADAGTTNQLTLELRRIPPSPPTVGFYFYAVWFFVGFSTIFTWE